MPQILEGIVTTANKDGSMNVSPMGPIVDASLARFQLRPYETSTTSQNLQRSGCGVFHVTDNVLMLAQAAVGQVTPPPKLRTCPTTGCDILEDACRWYALKVAAIDDSQPRWKIDCHVVNHGRQRDFFGFNRAKHAVLEAAILATRIALLPGEEISLQLERLQTIVDKTAGEQERQAMELLKHYVQRELTTNAG